MEIKERPILFSGPMVKAILEGRKTQTRRRIVKPKPEAYSATEGLGLSWGKKCGGGNEWLTKWCPYGKPGDRVWVRETWYCDQYLAHTDDATAEEKREFTVYRADGEAPYEAEQPVWRPSIHMPRWASRLTLEITEVRVQRLQEISEEDAEAEGFDEMCEDCGNSTAAEAHWVCEADNDTVAIVSRRIAFLRLWDSINAKRKGCAWSDNPWVWAISFKLLAQVYKPADKGWASDVRAVGGAHEAPLVSQSVIG